MSSQEYMDGDEVERAKRQIRALVSEIARFSKSEMAPQEFYGEMLTRVVSALAAVGGVVWTLENQNQIALQYQVNLQESGIAEKSEEDKTRHARLLQKVLRGGEGMLVPPHSGAGNGEEAANPTDFLLVLGPLKTELEVVGVVEIFQRPDTGLATQDGYLRFVTQVCDLACDYLKSRQLRSFGDRQVLWTQLEEFTRSVHACLNPRDTAYTIANEARRLIECDRVSVAIRKGEKCAIEAVSGQDLFDKRSNTIRLLNRLATVVVAGGEPVWYSGDTSQLAPQIEEAVQEYIDESHSKTVAVLPLARPAPEEKEKERPDDPLELPEPVGALVVEQIEDSRVPDKMLQRVHVVSQHSSLALANAMEHENLFLMPVWRTLGKTRWVLQARRLPKVIAGAVAAVALVVFLAVCPYPFWLHATGTIEPVVRHDVFPGIDGYVDDVKVKDNQIVRKGDLLAVLRNDEIKATYEREKRELDTARQQRDSIESTLNDARNLSSEDAAKLYGQLNQLRHEISNLEGECDTYKHLIDQSRVLSPADGMVVTFDVKNKLQGRNVQKVTKLMRIADPTRGWQLELHMADDRIGYVMAEQNSKYAETRAPEKGPREATRRAIAGRSAE